MLILFHKNSILCPNHLFGHSSVQGRSPSNSSEATRTPQEARTKEEVRLTPVKLDEPDFSWLNTNIIHFSMQNNYSVYNS